MPCFGNGLSTGSIIEHFRYTGVTTNGAAETILISWLVTKHVRMEQMVAHWEAIPPTSEFIYLRKLSGTDARINTVLRRVDPSLTASGGENLTDLACVIPFYWEVGDTVQITYANTDDQEVGVEIMLVEVE